MYDLKEIKSIPCSDIANKYGIKLKQKHNRLWGKLRPDEKTSSFSINLVNNLWYDFGSGKGGSVIDLLAELEGISPTEAINRLAEEYGIAGEEVKGWRPLTDNQYRELGIQPERATMNFKFDLNKHTEEQLYRWHEKYGMHISILATEYPKVYNKMVTKIAIDNINILRKSYYARLDTYHKKNTNDITKEFVKSLSKDAADEINDKVDLLQRAVITGVNYAYLKVNFEKDFGNKELDNKIKHNSLSDDEIIRDRIVSVYKNLFNYDKADYFTIEQAKALRDINIMICNHNNKFLSIDNIKKIHNMLGVSLDKLENKKKSIMKKGESYKDKNTSEYQAWYSKTSKLNNQILKEKEVFNKCNIVLDGIKERNLAIKNERSKTNIIKNNELTI